MLVEINPVYLMLILFVPWLMKIIDTGQLIKRQKVSFSPVLNSIYYIFGVFSILTSLTMFNDRGIIYHRLMVVVLFGLTAFIFIPSVFVKPTLNSIITTVVMTFVALFSGILIFFLISNPKYSVLVGFLIYLVLFFMITPIFHNLLNKLHPKGRKVLFYKQKLWELLNDQRLLIPVFSLFALEWALQFYGYTILFFLPF